MAFYPYDNRQKQNAYQNGGQRNGGYSSPTQQAHTTEIKELPIKYVDAAEQIMREMAELKARNGYFQPISTTKLRKMFGLFNELYNDSRRSCDEILTEKQLQVLTSARVRIVYECGRDKRDKPKNEFENTVEFFVKRANLLEYLKSIGNSRKKLMNYYNYFEALVAYHRFYFGEVKERGQ